MEKLDTFVIKRSGPKESSGWLAEARQSRRPNVEILAQVFAEDEDFKVESVEVDEGEQAEIASEKDTIAVGLAMPFKVIDAVPAAMSADTGPSWGIPAIGAENLDETAGRGVKVAVLDTGIAPHEAFEGLHPITKNFTDEDDRDIDGHGSHCAGTIFGQDVGGRRIGIARGVREPLIGKVLGHGGGATSDIVDAILWARRKKAHVISMSLGMDFMAMKRRLMSRDRSDAEATSIALKAYRDNVRMFDDLSKLFAHGQGFVTPLLIAASGNESRRRGSRNLNGARPFTIATAPPAVADDILSVGALSQGDKIWTDSNTFPDCCAPGDAIESVDIEGGLKALSGTSMAAPHVTGVAVLEATKLAAEGPFTANDLRQAVLSNAQKMPGISRLDGGVGKIMVA